MTDAEIQSQTQPLSISIKESTLREWMSILDEAIESKVAFRLDDPVIMTNEAIKIKDNALLSVKRSIHFCIFRQ